MKQKNKAEIISWKGMNCVQLTASGYTALIAPEIGSNVLRLHDDTNGIEFFRWNPDNTPKSIRQSPEVWGLPTLYLPNRFADGVLKISDHTYHLPVNEKEPYHNHIHGFLHKRKHTITAYSANEVGAWVRTAYVYNEEDPFFQYLPLLFTASFLFILSDCGLEYQFSMINQSNAKLPISIATHTTISAPFVDGAKEEDIRIQVPVQERWVLNERCLPTEEILPLSEYDKKYLEEGQCPVKRVVDNEMYTAGKLKYQGKPFRGVKNDRYCQRQGDCLRSLRRVSLLDFVERPWRKALFLPGADDGDDRCSKSLSASGKNRLSRTAIRRDLPSGTAIPDNFTKR